VGVCVRRLAQGGGRSTARRMGSRILILGLLLSVAAAPADPGARPVAAEAVALTRIGNRVDVEIAGRPFTTFHFDPSVAKPYFAPLRSPAGTIVTRRLPVPPDIPGEDGDEPHQRSMYFAHGDINGFDFWGEAEFAKWSDHDVSTFGRTVFRTLDDIRGGSDDGVLDAVFDLVTPRG